MSRNLLKILRGERSQSEMAKQYCVTQPCWHSWEAGRTVPDNATMLRMERDFDVPMEAIFFDAFNYKTKCLPR